MFPRKIALPISLALTALIGFAITSLASDLGWLSEAAPAEELAAATQEAQAAPTDTAVPPTSTSEPPRTVIVTDYVYKDVPVYREVPAAIGTEASPSPTATTEVVAAGVPLGNVYDDDTEPEDVVTFDSWSGDVQASSSDSSRSSAAPSEAASPASGGDDGGSHESEDHEDEQEDEDEHEDEHD